MNADKAREDQQTTTYFIKESMNFIFKSGTSGNCSKTTELIASKPIMTHEIN